MRPSVAWLFGLFLVASAAGCRNNSALVESDLRKKECEIRQLRNEVDRRGAYNQALEQELCNLRNENLPPGSPERTLPAYPVKKIVLSRGTGGRREEGSPGDEALEVHLEPQDPEGHAIKAPGTAIVQAVEIGSDGIKRPLASWEVCQDQLRRSWRSGLLNTGYVLILPWQGIWPSTEKLRVTAQLRLTDGRVFEDDKDINVHVVPVNQRPIPTPEPVVGPSISKEMLPGPQCPAGNVSKEGVPSPDANNLSASPAVKRVAEILRPVPLNLPATGASDWSKPIRTSPAN